MPADKKGTKGLVQDAGSWLTGSTRAWIRHVRPALFALPVILLFVAALVWWPAPGTSVEDNTSNAAPLQKITRPNETIPATGSQVDATESESSQVDVQSGSGPGNSSQVEPETASQADVSPTAAAEDNEAAGQQSESFRVLTYD